MQNRVLSLSWWGSSLGFTGKIIRGPGVGLIGDEIVGGGETGSLAGVWVGGFLGDLAMVPVVF